MAHHRQQALEWLNDKRANLADPEFQRLYRGYDEAVDWDPADPRLEELADALVRYAEQHEEATLEPDVNPTVLALLASYFSNASSAGIERLNELTEEKGGGRGVDLEAQVVGLDRFRHLEDDQARLVLPVPILPPEKASGSGIS